jgi:torulene dioxygenase
MSHWFDGFSERVSSQGRTLAQIPRQATSTIITSRLGVKPPTASSVCLLPLTRPLCWQQSPTQAIQAAYIHSMFLTEHYVVLCIFDAYFAAGGLKMLWARNMLDAMYFDPQKKSKWLVVDRVEGKGLVAVFGSEPCFSFHCVNAWEEKSGKDPKVVDIILEVPAYENLDILKRFYYENMKATASGSRAYVGENRLRARPHFTRWKLSGVTNTTKTPSTPRNSAERLFTLSPADTMELPTFNPPSTTKPSRYIYG